LFMLGIKDSRIIYTIKEYREKIIKEDIQLLKEKKSSLPDREWLEYFSRYEDGFISQNKMLFELVIKDYLYPDYSSGVDIENISFIASKKTLDFIVNKINLQTRF